MRNPPYSCGIAAGVEATSASRHPPRGRGRRRRYHPEYEFYLSTPEGMRYLSTFGRARRLFYLKKRNFSTPEGSWCPSRQRTAPSLLDMICNIPHRWERDQVSRRWERGANVEGSTAGWYGWAPQSETRPLGLPKNGAGGLRSAGISPVFCPTDCAGAVRRGSGAPMPRDAAAQFKELGNGGVPNCSGTPLNCARSKGRHSSKVARPQP